AAALQGPVQLLQSPVQPLQLGPGPRLVAHAELERVSHAVEGRRELSDLVSLPHGDMPLHAAGGYLLCLLRELFHWFGDVAGEPVYDERADHEEHDGDATPQSGQTARLNL